MISTTVKVHDLELREVNCGACTYRWLSTPVLDTPGNFCPNCMRPATEATAGPVKRYSFDLPLK